MTSTNNPSRFERFKGEAQAHMKAVDALLAEAKADRRALTGDESAEAWQHIEDARNSTSAAVKAKEAEGIRQAMADLLGPVGSSYVPSGGAAYGRPGTKGRRGAEWADLVVAANSDGVGRFKSLTPSGAVLVPVPAPPVISLGQPVNSLRSVISSEPTAGAFSYLRQTVRTNNAAPVAPGAKKPTSVYSTALVEDRARVIAHLSEPVSRMDLADAPALSDFLTSEMVFGLERAIEDQILNGSGLGEEFTGIANTSGVLTVPFATDLITTTRKAVTALESQGLPGDAWVFNPVDWEAIELAANSTGSLLLAESGARVPVESAARRLWSRPVIASTACNVGEAYFGDFAGSARVFLREEARIDWSDSLYSEDRFGAGIGGTLFEGNMVAMRVESRVGFGVLRPSGFAKLDLTAA